MTMLPIDQSDVLRPFDPAIRKRLFNPLRRDEPIISRARAPRASIVDYEVVLDFRGLLIGVAPVDVRSIRISDVIATVAMRWGQRKADLVSNRRTEPLIEPRHVAMTLAKHLTPASLPEIGRSFGRDHTVVLYATRKYRALIEQLLPIMPPSAGVFDWANSAYLELHPESA
jgi:hypothetical protein